MGTLNIGSNTLAAIDNAEMVAYSIRVIEATYGKKVSVDLKAKSLLKFGRNQRIGTSPATIMTLPSGIDNEVYVSDNLIDTISSDNASDVGQTIRIEGHTISGSDLTFVVQTVTLNGRNKVTLSTPLARMTRLANQSGTELVGEVYGYEDTAITNGVPNDGTKVHCMIRQDKQQSEKASTSISSEDFWIITTYAGDVIEKSSAFADIQLQIRESGGVFRQRTNKAASSGAGFVAYLCPPIIVPSNSDVRLVATASGSNIDVSGQINGYLAKVIA